MIRETNNKTIRQNKESEVTDTSYLRDFYSKNDQFPLFSQVLIETRTDCNKRCSFCPQSFYQREQEVMRWDIFQRIINSLASIGFAGRLVFLVTNEPLLEVRLIQMIKYSKQISSRFFIDLTTNGTLLNLEIVEKLFAAGLDNLSINDYRPDRKINQDKVSDNLVPIISTFKHNPKLCYTPRSDDEIWPNYAGVIPQNFDKTNFGFCNFPFRKIVFSVKGNVMLCCNDYFHETNFGNILNEPILSIWHSESINEIRSNLLNNIRIGLCSKCNDKQDYSVF